MTVPGPLRIGVDLGGSKIAAVVMDNGSRILFNRRVATPAGDYDATVAAVAQMVAELENEAGADALPVGVGTPGALSPATGRIKNANSVCLNGRPLKRDLENALGREIRMANDADCLAVSEAADGAAAGAASVFAAILGTGVGGGVAINGRLLSGPNAIAGEWGHNPLPWPDPDSEMPGPTCWCGRLGCIETWLSGPGLAADYRRRGGGELAADEIARRARAGESQAIAALAAYRLRLAKSLATVINLLDPEVIVLGGGMSQIRELYEQVPRLWNEFVFSERVATRLLPAAHGDASGVRGAAWLNPVAADGGGQR